MKRRPKDEPKDPKGQVIPHGERCLCVACRSNRKALAGLKTIKKALKDSGLHAG